MWIQKQQPSYFGSPLKHIKKETKKLKVLVIFKAKSHLDELVSQECNNACLFRTVSILLEVDRRYGNRAICIKYNGSLNSWLISPDPKANRQHEISNIKILM